MGTNQKTLNQLKADLRKLATPERAKSSARFFKTGPGQYGEGDQFIGVSVPDQRKVAKRYQDLVCSDAEALLMSPIHEERLTALFILVSQFRRGDEKIQKEIYTFYVRNAKLVNNWDLVDSSAPYFGYYLLKRDRSILYRLAKSSNLWERRIAIMMTFAFIMEGESETTLEIADMLLHDDHDLIQKAVGWMLREVGKHVSQQAEEVFLATRYQTMPRTMLRYAIERFEPERRQQYLKGEI